MVYSVASTILIYWFNIIFSQHLIQTNTGINQTPFKFTKHSNAYMLVYIRESDKDKIICQVNEKDIAEHLRVSILAYGFAYF